MQHSRLSEIRKKAPVVKLKPNKQKIIQALLYLIREAEKRELKLTQYTVLKTFFLADRAHLNKYGRPVTFDNYVAMKDGPVASFIYDVLKDKVDTSKIFEAKGQIWQKTAAPHISKKAFLYHSAAKEPQDLDHLSESDQEALSDALTIASALSFHQLRKLTHEDPAYLDAWEDENEATSYEMSYGMLFDTPNFDRAKELSFLSEHQ